MNAPLGNVDHLALMLHRFIEVETGQLQKKEKKAADKDRARIAAQVAEEQARSVSAVAGKLLFQAHRASAQAGEVARHQRLLLTVSEVGEVLTARSRRAIVAAGLAAVEGATTAAAAREPVVAAAWAVWNDQQSSEARCGHTDRRCSEVPPPSCRLTRYATPGSGGRFRRRKDKTVF